MTDINVVIVALGVNTVDELRPLVALARGLINSKDIKVSIVSHEQYASELTGEQNINFLDGGPCPFWARSNTPEGKALQSRKGGDMSERLKVFMGMLTTQWFERGKDIFDTMRPDVAILASTSAMFVYPTLCELLNIKMVVSDNSPMSKTAEFGPPRGFGISQAGFRHVNLQRWSTHSKSMWNVLYQHGVNELRLRHGLPVDAREDGPWSDLTDVENDVPVLLTYSDCLLPRPLEWSKKITIVGPPPDVVSVNEKVASSVFRKFLDGNIGKPVVFINFGTQFNSYGNRETRLKILKSCTTEALRVGWRCVVVCPSANGVSLDSIRSSDVEVLGGRQATAATISALWTHCSMVLCSGDPWTIHSALRRGVPIGVIDFARDDTPDAFWGGRVEAVGVGLAPIPVSSVLDSATCIGHALNSVITPGTIAQKAKSVAQAISAKDDGNDACSLVHEVLMEVLGRKYEKTLHVAAVKTSTTAVTAAAEVISTSSLPPVQIINEAALSHTMPPVVSPMVSSKSKTVSGGGGTSDGRPMAGFSFNDRGVTGGNPDASNVWRKGEDSMFKLRTGPNYKKLGKKAPSAPSLYELVAVDMIRSKKRMTDFSQYLRYPEPDIDTHHQAVPPMIIMNGTIPTETPSMMSPASDGPTLNVLFFFAIKPTTCDALADLKTAPPAVRLLADFCSKAQTKPEMFARFKCIGMARNYDEAGMPSMFKSFNGKPCLVRDKKNKGTHLLLPLTLTLTHYHTHSYSLSLTITHSYSLHSLLLTITIARWLWHSDSWPQLFGNECEYPSMALPR